jgi:alkyl sulfatase BDS1-like metallo-beta-lactamase superfamily hydrolase
MAYGLCEVLPDRIYQVRGIDPANITFVKRTPAGSCSIR